MSILLQTTVRSPLGPLRLLATELGIRGVYYTAHKGAPELPARELADHPVLLRARRQLEEYFAGARHDFDLPLDVLGTPFQRRVWRALTELPYGQTATYGELAARLQAPRAARAVGRANALNPISIIVPCHRVIGSGGKLTGYAGGLACKQWLLEHEREHSDLRLQASLRRPGSWRAKTPWLNDASARPSSPNDDVHKALQGWSGSCGSQAGHRQA
jgi:methylated-DNA-[protein]-cysteine S-methyltransferase